MKAQSVKNFNFGFELNESELRKIINLCREQIDKIRTDSVTVENYNVAFQNGAIVEDLNLEEVLELDNHGSGKIVSLEIIFRKKPVDDNEKINSIIEITFNDKTFEAYKQNYPITTKLEGDSRDWVFVTSSLINERIEKIKRKTYFLELNIYSEYRFLIILMLALVFIVIGNFYYAIKENKVVENYNIELENIKIKNKEKGKLKSKNFTWEFSAYDSIFEIIYNEKIDSIKKIQNLSIVDAMVLIDKVKNEANKQSRETVKTYSDSIKTLNENGQDLTDAEKIDSTNFNNLVEEYKYLKKTPTPIQKFSILSLTLIPLFLFFLLKYIFILYPLYNFIWGDYEQVFERKNKNLKFIIYSVIIGITLSIVANKLTNLL